MNISTFFKIEKQLLKYDDVPLLHDDDFFHHPLRLVKKTKYDAGEQCKFCLGKCFHPPGATIEDNTIIACGLKYYDYRHCHLCCITFDNVIQAHEHFSKGDCQHTVSSSLDEALYRHKAVSTKWLRDLAEDIIMRELEPSEADTILAQWDDALHLQVTILVPIARVKRCYDMFIYIFFPLKSYFASIAAYIYKTAASFDNLSEYFHGAERQFRCLNLKNFEKDDNEDPFEFFPQITVVTKKY